MYLSHFGLREAPFGLTPNTGFYYGLPPHEEAMQVLNWALSQGEGFIKVTGEVGTGKTLLCRKLLSELGSEACPVRLAWLPNPHLTPGELRTALALELGLTLAGESELDLTDRIHRHLISLHRQGSRVVVLIDEAQALPDETLEAIRLFGNLETESSKLLQIVLFGQPELDNRLGKPVCASCASASASPTVCGRCGSTRPGPIWSTGCRCPAIAGPPCSMAAPCAGCGAHPAAFPASSTYWRRSA